MRQATAVGHTGHTPGIGLGNVDATGTAAASRSTPTTPSNGAGRKLQGRGSPSGGWQEPTAEDSDVVLGCVAAVLGEHDASQVAGSLYGYGREFQGRAPTLQPPTQATQQQQQDGGDGTRRGDDGAVLNQQLADIDARLADIGWAPSAPAPPRAPSPDHAGTTAMLRSGHKAPAYAGASAAELADIDARLAKIGWAYGNSIPRYFPLYSHISVHIR